VGLFILVGWFLTKKMGWDWALPVALVAGLLVAPLIPAKTACSVKPKSAPTQEEDPSRTSP